MDACFLGANSEMRDFGTTVSHAERRPSWLDPLCAAWKDHFFQRCLMYWEENTDNKREVESLEDTHFTGVEISRAQGPVRTATCA